MVKASDTEKRKKAAALTQHAVELTFRGRFGEALGFAEQALAMDDAYARAYAAKAICLVQLGDAEKGLEAAERAVALEGNVGVFYSIRALCKARRRDYAAAEADYERGLALSPDDFKVHYNYACYWAERGDEEKCRAYLQAALELADAGFADVAPFDPDLARFHERPWFRELLAAAKKRVVGG